MTDLMPAIFFGHGNPMNAITKNAYSDAFASVGRSIPRPRAVLSISAHWYIPACAVTADPAPRTIHDFGGFPEALYQVEYRAPGSLELVRRATELLSPVHIEPDKNWGLDHGTWSVLIHVFPNADIPVVQLSIHSRQPPDFHYETGKRLAPLREEGILIIGSGNIVHNLSAYAWENPEIQPFDWAMRFEKKIRDLLLEGDDSRIIAYDGLGPEARLSAPTPEHFLPLLYVLGMQKKNDPITFPVQGVDGGAISMLAVQIG